MAKSRGKKSETHTFTSLVLPNDLHTELRKACLDERRKMQDVVEELVRAYLAKKHRAH